MRVFSAGGSQRDTNRPVFILSLTFSPVHLLTANSVELEENRSILSEDFLRTLVSSYMVRISDIPVAALDIIYVLKCTRCRTADPHCLLSSKYSGINTALKRDCHVIAFVPDLSVLTET